MEFFLIISMVFIGLVIGYMTRLSQEKTLNELFRAIICSDCIKKIDSLKTQQKSPKEPWFPDDETEKERNVFICKICKKEKKYLVGCGMCERCYEKR